MVAALEASGSHTTGDRNQMGIPQTDESSAQTKSEAGTSSSGGSQAARWRCTVCGYIYDPAQNEGIPFESLPSTWKCPCGAPKSKFVKT